MAKSLAFIVGILTPLIPSLVSAHEVYVLDAETIARSIAVISPNPFTAYIGNEFNFFFWGFISFVTVSTILCSSVFRVFERKLDPFLFYLKRWAHLIVRVTAGLCLISYGIATSFFGPELPLPEIFGSGTMLMQALFLLLGVCILVGLQTRLCAFLALLVFLYGTLNIGIYSLTYLGHVGAYLFLIIRGGGEYTIDHSFHLGWQSRKQAERVSLFAFPVLRVTFGLGIIFASLYGKLWHSQLALEVITRYGLTAYFPFDPLFVVLGALIIEFAAGLMLVLGIEVRWTTLFLLFWLILSHMYFREAFWVHLPLFGYGIAIFCHGYDRYSLEGRLFKGRGVEPVF